MASGKWQKSLQGKIHESIVHFSSRWRQAMTASFPFATPLMRHRQLGRGSRIFCGVWGNRSCVVDSGGPEPAKPCPSHDSTQAAMACPSSISEHPRPWHSGCHRSAAPLPRAQNKARSSLAASPSLRISASRDAAARVLGARFVVFRQSCCRTRNARIWTPPNRLTREPND